MQAAQREVWWADLKEPIGSTPGWVRPVVIVQSDSLNASRLTTYLYVPLSGVLRRSAVPWNLVLSAAATGLDKDSIAQANLMSTLAEEQLIERVGRISEKQLMRLFDCIDIAMGRN